MSRKGSAEQRELEVVPEIPAHFSYRPAMPLNVRIREYLIANGISFQQLCEVALLNFLSAHPRWPNHDLRLPKGKRPRIR